MAQTATWFKRGGGISDSMQLPEGGGGGTKHLRAAVSLYLPIKYFYGLVVEVNIFTDPN